MRYIEAKLDGSNLSWSSGVDIIDLTITLGQDNTGTTCNLQVADPDSVYASALVKHSLTAGGIQSLNTTAENIPDTNAINTSGTTLGDTQPTTEAAWELAIVKGCLQYGVTNKNAIAYVLATAWKETTMGADLVNESAIFEGNVGLGNTRSGDGKRYIPRGLVQITGRSNYAKIGKVIGADLLGQPELLTQARYAIPAAVLGMKQGTFTRRKLGDFFNDSKADFYNARTIINGHESAAIVADKAQNVYRPKVDALIAKANGSVQNIQPKQSVDYKAQPQEVVKGNKLTVSVGDTTFEFFHQGTDTSNLGITTITGQGVRYILSRRKRNKTEQNLSLSALARKVCTAHRLKLDYQALIDPIYQHIDQTNMTDYELLKRECEFNGLFLSESKGTITIKSLVNIIDTDFVAAIGSNIITYNIRDVALDTSQDDQGSALLQAQEKVTINPITGQFEQVRVDIDNVNDASSTGSDKSKTNGTLKPGQEPIAVQSRARKKRVKGLPSTFVVTLTEDTLRLEPLNTLRTTGISEVFDRVWLIDSVTHSVAAGTSSITCYSPIEVLVPVDNSQPTSTTPTETPTEAVAKLNPTGYIWAAHGLVTSLVGRRTAPVRGASTNHRGTDIGVPIGTVVVAGKDGIVVGAIPASQGGGAGNYITIKHNDGIQTLYMHLSRMDVRAGQVVKQGQQIGLSGNTGIGSGAHLHYEFRRNGQALRPVDVGLGNVVKGQRV